MDKRNLYSDCLAIHALRWQKSHQDLGVLEYIEFHGGPILSHFIHKYGADAIIKDLTIEIERQSS